MFSIPTGLGISVVSVMQLMFATPVPSDLQIRLALREPEAKWERHELVMLGPRPFPAYLRILASKDTDLIVVANLFHFLLRVEGTDRSQFVEPAVAGLTSPEISIRYTAVNLLAQIGGVADAAPVVALLSDVDPRVSKAAASALVAMGDRRTVVAIDVWLKSASHLGDKELREHVAKCREDLKQRLDKPTPPGK